MDKTLKEIFDLYNSDKSHKHKYEEIYEPEFSKNRHKEINILEIGIFQGASILSWAEYFPNAKVYGVDIDLNFIIPENREPIYTNPKINVRAINSMLKPDFGEVRFDYIIDDGDHSFNAQVETFRNYFPFLKNGGTYFIEDVYFGANYLQQEGLSVVNDKPAIAGLLNFFADYKLEHCFTSSTEPDSYIIKIRK